MELNQLEKQLDQSLEAYRKETIFTVDTFDQPHYNEEVTKETLEQMGRSTYYTLYEFKKSIMNYLKEGESKWN